MARKSRAEKQREKAVSDAIQRNCVGKQINVMNLSKVTDEVTEAANNGEDLDEAAKTVTDKYNEAA